MRPVIAVTPQPESIPHRQTRTAAYLEILQAVGADTRQLPLDLLPAAAASVMGAVHGLVLIGGGDPAKDRYPPPLSDAERATLTYVDPRLDQLELEMLAVARRVDLPVLGICRGMQMMNLACEGSLQPDIALANPHTINHNHPDPLAMAHVVEWDPSTRLGRWLGDSCSRVNSRHHQAIGVVGNGLVVAGVAADGVVEALERPDAQFFCGVQFHPERMPGARRLFEEFVAAAGQQARSSSLVTRP